MDPKPDLPVGNARPHHLALALWVITGVAGVAWLAYFEVFWPSVRRAGEHWFLTLLFVVLLLVIAAVAGRGIGLPELFRADPSRPGRLRWLRPFSAGFGAATFVAGCLVAVYFIDLLNDPLSRPVPRPGWAQPPLRLPAFVVIGSTPLLVLILLAVAFPLGGRASRVPGEVAAYLGAAAAALAAFVAVTWAGGGLIDAAGWNAPGLRLVSEELFKGQGESGHKATVVAIWVSLALLVVAALVVLLSMRAELLSPGLGLTLVFCGAACLYFFTVVLKPEYQPVFVLLLMGVVVVANRSAFRYRYPGVGAENGPDPYSARLALGKFADPEKAEAPRLDEGPVLDAWAGANAENPHLVLLAVSGGAYRASFWVGVVLDAIEREARLAGLTDRVRLVTGASGGMVGAAYHVALRHRFPDPRSRPGVVEAMTADTGGDSLTRVVRQFLRRDLPFLFWPVVSYQARDRGTELERHWSAINLPFQALAEGEAAGRLPSLVFSPMLVETGRPLYVSNLRLGWLAGYPDEGGTEWTRRRGLELFELFPAAARFGLQTAVRMNAAFPYVSPAVKLPTDPPLRVVDAGYRDNYGLSTAAAWLYHHRDWIVRNTTGVTVIVLRAFADTPIGRPKGMVEHVLQAFQFLTSPIEGATAARGSRMQDQNRELMRLAKAALGFEWDRLGPEGQSRARGFRGLDVIEFAYPGEAAMNWFISRETIADMGEALGRGGNKVAWDRLLARWSMLGNHEPPAPVAPAGDA